MALVLVVLRLMMQLMAADFLVKGAINFVLRLGISAVMAGHTVMTFGTLAP